MLRMHKKTNKIQFYHITDKAKNNQRIKEMRKTCVCVCVCLDAGWCLVSTFKRFEIYGLI
jgi:hypothetical protein